MIYFTVTVKKLSTYIYKHSDGKIVPLTIAINPKSQKMFSLYPKSEELQKCLDVYKEENSQNK